MSQTDLFIIDNSEESKTVKDYLRKWCPLSKQMDIATGYLEIGGLLALDGEWQKLDKIRILLGDEVTPRTKRVIDGVVSTLLGRVASSVDAEQARDDFLLGVPAIVRAMLGGKIECRVYTRDKFHAKAYITHLRENVHEALPSALNIPRGYALVGSSNFTAAGLTKNVELNVQIAHDVDQLQAWFERQWEQGEDITGAVLKTIETRTREYAPHDVYLRAMYEYFKGHEETVSEWERERSAVYPVLSQYQRDGYNNLVAIADKHGGAFLCDGVGLGKTYVGLMLIERFVKQERRNVVLVVPAAARKSVWEIAISRHMPEILDGFYPFRIVNHTDLIRGPMQNLMDQIADHGEVVIVDEAHHFRNRTGRSYRKLFDIMGRGPRKKLFMLTATPINNDFRDLQHLIELFTLRKADYFASLGIHSLEGHFDKLERAVSGQTGRATESEERQTAFAGDPLVRELVVQRSRAYVKRSLTAEEGAAVLFPSRKTPVVAGYSMEETCGDLLAHFKTLFDRRDKRGKPVPILSLAVYAPYEDPYYTGDLSLIDPMKRGRQQQVVALIRQLLLKRFESSVAAFQETCVRIFQRLKTFLVDFRDVRPRLVDRTLARQADVIGYVEDYIARNLVGDDETLDDFDDQLPDYVWDVEANLDRADFDIGAMIDDTVLDIDSLSMLIRDMIGFDPVHDDKLNALKRLLREEPRLQGRKLLIFTEYRATAKYLERELAKDGFPGLVEIDGMAKTDRHELVRRFSPYYNGASSADLGGNEIRTLVATDVLSEGLNLQDASRLINYELHWNPVRLMQRIGRVDRRRIAAVEQRLLADHPDLAADRSEVVYWNFLPPDELENLLSLYKTVSHKTLRISKVFGIEGSRLLTPEDDYAALNDFNARYEGTTSPLEELALACQQLLAENPGYAEAAKHLPAKMHSGKATPAPKGVFFCYLLPVKNRDGEIDPSATLCRWYLYDTAARTVTEDVPAIWQAIRCPKDEPRVLTLASADFLAIRREIEKHLRNHYLKSIQAPLGTVPRLVAWMQLA